MHLLRSLNRLMVVVAAASALSVNVPYLAAKSSVGDTNTTTATATCGNGLIALGPIVVPLAPNSTTVIQCQ